MGTFTNITKFLVAKICFHLFRFSSIPAAINDYGNFLAFAMNHNLAS